MTDQDILGMKSASEYAKECDYGSNMFISASLVVEMTERIAELEKSITTSTNVMISLQEDNLELEKERFTFKKIISNPAMTDYDKYVHIHDMLKEQGE